MFRINIIGKPSQKMVDFCDKHGITIVSYRDNIAKLIADNTGKITIVVDGDLNIGVMENIVMPVSKYEVDESNYQNYINEDGMRSFLMSNKFQRKRGRW